MDVPVCVATVYTSLHSWNRISKMKPWTYIRSSLIKPLCYRYVIYCVFSPHSWTMKRLIVMRWTTRKRKTRARQMVRPVRASPRFCHSPRPRRTPLMMMMMMTSLTKQTKPRSAFHGRRRRVMESCAPCADPSVDRSAVSKQWINVSLVTYGNKNILNGYWYNYNFLAAK